MTTFFDIVLFFFFSKLPKDFICGDRAHIRRAINSAGAPRVNVRTGAWHRDVVLEETVNITRMETVAADQLAWITTDPTRAMALADAHMVFAGGRVDARGSQVRCYVCTYSVICGVVGLRMCVCTVCYVVMSEHYAHGGGGRGPVVVDHHRPD